MKNSSLTTNVTEVFAKLFMKAVKTETNNSAIKNRNSKIGWDIHLEKVNDLVVLFEYYQNILADSQKRKVKTLLKQIIMKVNTIQNPENSDSLLYNIYEIHAYINAAVNLSVKKGSK